MKKGEVNARLKNCNVNVKIILTFCLFQIYGGEKYHRFELFVFFFGGKALQKKHLSYWVWAKGLNWKFEGHLNANETERNKEKGNKAHRKLYILNKVCNTIFEKRNK